VVALLVFGAMIEITQTFLPWREMSFMDWLADALGISLSYIIICIINR
jgi:VanZ family protein